MWKQRNHFHGDTNCDTFSLEISPDSATNNIYDAVQMGAICSLVQFIHQIL